MHQQVWRKVFDLAMGMRQAINFPAQRRNNQGIRIMACLLQPLFNPRIKIFYEKTAEKRLGCYVDDMVEMGAEKERCVEYAFNYDRYVYKGLPMPESIIWWLSAEGKGIARWIGSGVCILTQGKMSGKRRCCL